MMSKLSNRDFFKDRFEHLLHLPEHVLFDQIARNDAAPMEYRLTAVEIMVKKGYKKANHPDLARFREVLDAEKEEFGERKIPNLENENEVLEPISGPPAASVTTATMFGSPKVDFQNPQTFTLEYSCGHSESVISPNAQDPNGQIAAQSDEDGVFHYTNLCDDCVSKKSPENGHEEDAPDSNDE